MSGFVEHDLIAPGLVARRDYQLAIAVEATRRSTLVILPTGMGKTVIALLVMAHRVKHAPGKVLFLAPTKPLVEQHAAFLREAFRRSPVEVFTGETPPEERELAWRTAAVVCSTPQVVQNDLVSGRIDLSDVTLVVFDEAHRTTGNYAYGFIAERFRRDRAGGLALGITASPGANADKIRDVCTALGIEGVEARSEWDADTREYVQDVDVEWKPVAVPENLRRIAEVLREMLNEKVGALRSVGAYNLPFASRKELLATGARLQAAVRSADAGGNAGAYYQALSAQAAALKIHHALELVETQGVGALETYLARLATDESKAAKGILADARMVHVRDLADRKTVEHPKLRQVAVILRQQMAQKADSRVIVFTNYRDTADLLVRELTKVDGLRPVKFVGQASRSDADKGLTQKEQVRIVEEFKAGAYNVLVATSVAEEGLDIPATDLVVFYEPVPSEIRSIQRRGRTGRKRAGRVVILVTKKTSDEAYLHASRHREKRMKKEIETLKAHFAAVNASESSTAWRAHFSPSESGQSTLAPRVDAPPPAFATAAGAARPERAIVVVDHREFASAVAKELARLDVIVRPDALATGDYVVSDRIAIERKEAEDYVTSLLDGRLFEQARALRDAYSAPVVIVEGENLLTARKITADAIYSSLASLVADYRVAVFQSKNAAETAAIVAALAKREQLRERRAIALRAGKGAMTDDERLRFIVEGLPGVSAVLAKRLLRQFGSVRALVDANVAALMEVDGVGEVTATEIHRVLRLFYAGME